MDTVLKQSQPKCKALVYSKASAPGSLMLFGEHAVLQGKLALACAIDKRVTVELTPRNDDVIQIVSSLGTYTTTVATIAQKPELSFITKTLSVFKEKLPSGFDLHIHSELSHTMGLGSSSAVTVATIAAIQQAVEEKYDPYKLFDKAVAVVRKVQGKASGTDVAATIFGGIVAYTMNPLTIEPLKKTCPITLLYSGKKLATSTVISMVLEKQKKYPKLYEQLFNAMEEITLRAKEAILAERFDEVGRLANSFNGLMDALGVNDSTLSECAWTLRSDPQITGAKISGSGLGDCVVGFGAATTTYSSQVSVQMSLEGVTILP